MAVRAEETSIGVLAATMRRAPAQRGQRGIEAGLHVCGDHRILRLAGPNIRRLHGFLLADGEPIHKRKGYGQSGAIVLGRGRETIDATEPRTIRQQSGAARGGKTLDKELRIIRALRGLELGLRLCDRRRSARSPAGARRSPEAVRDARVAVDRPACRDSRSPGRADAGELSDVDRATLYGLLGLCELGLCRGQFRLHSRFIRSGPQLRGTPARECFSEGPANCQRTRAPPRLSVGRRPPSEMRPPWRPRLRSASRFIIACA